MNQWEALELYINFARVLVERDRRIQREIKMATLSEVADRLAAKQEAHQAKADEWAARLDAIDKVEPTVFALTDAAITERETDLSKMEGNMQKLTNAAPLAKSPAVLPQGHYVGEQLKG